MRSYCSLSEIAASLDERYIHDTSPRIDNVLPIPIILEILSYLEPSITIEQGKHFCSPKHPCSVAFVEMQPFLQLRLVCRGFNIMCYMIWPRHALGQSWAYPTIDRRARARYGGYSLADIIKWNHIDGRYRHFLTLQEYDGYDGCSLAYDTGTPTGCSKDMPVVVLKALMRQKQYESELDAYTSIEQLRTPFDHSVAPMLIHHDRFPTAYQQTVYYFILEYLGPTLKDILTMSYYKRFTAKMTMAVAIQLIRKHQAMHPIHLLHNGAKPANYCLPPNPDTIVGEEENYSRPVCLIDFGFSRSYTPPPEGKDERQRNSGNLAFRSSAIDKGRSLSPREDLEGLAYTLAYLAKGYLPWYGGPLGYYMTDKRAVTTQTIFEGMDSIYAWFFDYVMAMPWGHLPDYEMILQNFAARWFAKGFGPNPGDFPWYIRSQHPDHFPPEAWHAGPNSELRSEALLRRWKTKDWEVFVPGPTQNEYEYEPPLPSPSMYRLPPPTFDEMIFFEPELQPLPLPDAEEFMYFRQGLPPFQIPLPPVTREEWIFFTYEPYQESMITYEQHGRAPTVDGQHLTSDVTHQNTGEGNTLSDTLPIPRTHELDCFSSEVDATDVALPPPHTDEFDWFRGAMDGVDVPLPAASEADSSDRTPGDIDMDYEEFQSFDFGKLCPTSTGNILGVLRAWEVALPRPDFAEYVWFFIEDVFAG
ncbi:hypothetical protein SISSUDRAFT_1127018 [Sistotremastrum suecicum HHB10207 ss-3]|uniref:Protein kinase domain-containing protein n=1 Tax=Sistotremastrum suecicum HHB10207 ss-3 TaxID=1314776 RepID=A0A166FIK8_9AGAM|nr:hypothetical protein SISSUDRAFT_1127018 [Sistotremastrum suecicum HHB10207 ss-3]